MLYTLHFKIQVMHAIDINIDAAIGINFVATIRNLLGIMLGRHFARKAKAQPAAPDIQEAVGLLSKK